MAVAVVATDTWLSHLEFTGPQRQTDFGPIDGIFYGVVSGTGDGSGGNLTLNGNVSFDRKEDWIYILKKVSASRTGIVALQTAFMVAATGPLIPTPTTVANASFHLGGIPQDITNNALTVFPLASGSQQLFDELPVFGDKRIGGPLSMMAMGWETNTNAAVYQMSVYGWLIRYQGFFRGVAPALG